MQSPDLTTVIVIGALVGLLFVALGYGQMVWLSRQNKMRSPGQASPLLTLAFWVLAGAAAFCLLHAATGGSLPDREGVLLAEDLFSVQPRTGLVANFSGTDRNVKRDDVLLRFTGQDGEEGQLAVKSRKRVLQGEYEIEKTRPLEYDHELQRQLDLAKSALRDREAREKQLVSERDSIVREASQQRLAVDNRRFGLEQDDHAAEHELTTLRVDQETQRKQLASEEKLLTQGLISNMEIARQRDLVKDLDTRIAALEDRRKILARERDEIGDLRSSSHSTFTSQLGSREAELKPLKGELEAARKTVAAASEALDQDRPRAMAQREKRLQQIQVQIDECDLLLSGRGRQSVLTAPWDGRVGFREPSPSSPPNDNGPLLVMYRPGKIAATVRLDPDETEVGDAELRADLQFAAPAGAEALSRNELVVRGTVVQRNFDRDAAELRIACDPPARIVRQLAMGGTVPVRVRLRHEFFGTTSFRVGVLLAAAALLALLAKLLRRRERGAAEEGAGSASGGPPAHGGGGSWHAPPGSMPQPANAAPYGAQMPMLAWQPYPALPPWPEEAARSGLPDPALLRSLGASLREEIETGRVASALVRTVGDVLRRGGYPAVGFVSSGFGVSMQWQTLNRAAFDLLCSVADQPPPMGGLRNATSSCAEFIQVMRLVGSNDLRGQLDRLREDLAASAQVMAETSGSSQQNAGLMVRPLRDA